jgi:hypothetical protein
MKAFYLADQCHSVPSPLAGEGQGGGYNRHDALASNDADKTVR